MAKVLTNSYEGNTPAVIVIKDEGYKKLVNTLSRQLALDGCEVKTTDSLDYNLQKIPYIIFVGTPSQQDLTILNSFTHKLIIVARASELSKLRQNLKQLPSYFLNHEYLQDLAAVSEEILEVLITQKPHKPITRLKRTRSSPQTQRRPSPFKPQDNLEILIEKKYHIPYKPIKISLFFILSAFAITFIAIYINALTISVKSNLIDAVTALQKAQFTTAQTKLERSQHGIQRLEQIYGVTKPAISLASPSTNQAILQLFSLGNKSNTILLELSDTGLRSQEFLVKLLQKKPQPIAPFAAYLEDRLTNLQQELIVLNKQYQDLTQQDHYLSKRFLAESGELENTLDTALEILPRFTNIAPILPELLADNGKKKYLLLFQNNMELRPTGGFIGSVGFLSFENGKMLEIAIDDVYNLDGQLEGHVDPPAPIRDYLGQPDWYLRDANWHPDFTRSAAQIQWFLDKEVNTKVDGVLALDLEAARNLLAALDGVYLSDFDTFITTENLYLETQSISEKEFFPGATNKRDILGSLARNILLEISTRDDLDFSTLTKKTYQSLTEKHILLNFNDSTIQSAFNNTGWTGRLLQPNCTAADDSSCILDYLMLVEANLGVNKVNFFTEGNTIVEVQLDKNRLRRSVTINTSNNSSSNEFPGGTYKNYLRILVPPDVILEQVTLDGNIIKLDKIARESIGRYQSWGIYIEIAPSKTSTLKFKYSSNYPTKSPAVYELMIQKQPGSKNTPVTFSLDADADQQLLPLNFTSITSRTRLAQTKTLLYNTSLDTDRIFRVKIQ